MPVLMKLFLLFAVIIASICVAKVSNVLNAERGGVVPDRGKPVAHRQRTVADFDDSEDNLFVFVQITDLHVSIFSDPRRVTEFEDLLMHHLPVIGPAAVVVSGDLTDARSEFLGSAQHRQEWALYYAALRKTRVLDKYAWLDVRGNHDTFNVANLADNYYRNYTHQGRRHQRSYAYDIEGRAGDRYTFIGIDASLTPGPKRPFNFIGQLSADEVDRLKALAANATGPIIWFGHYPTSCILTADGQGIRPVIGQYGASVAYLCGHLHTIGGLVPQMYSLQRAGFIELELGDWKDNRMFRVAAIDHGSLSFVDTRYNAFPIVLVTNPKDARFHIPGRENREAALQSSHIRILAFSTAPITECRVRINNEGSFQACEPRSARLYVAKWRPEQYATGSHTIEVVVTDELGRTQTVVQSFSLDNAAPAASSKLSARLMLMTDLCTIFHLLFAVAFCACLLPMVTMRIWHECVVRGHVLRPPRIRWPWLKRLVRKFWLLGATNRLFVPLVLFYTYLLVGPWTIGEVIDQHTGFVFLWGIFVQGTFLPGTLTYLYGFFQLLFCQFPLTIIYANMLDRKFRQQDRANLKSPANFAKQTKFRRLVLPHIPFVLIMLVELVLGVFFFISYGAISFVLGPLRTWSVVLHLYLFYEAFTLRVEQSMAAGAAVWSSPKCDSADGIGMADNL